MIVMTTLLKTPEDIDNFMCKMETMRDIDLMKFEALDRISCQLHNMEVLYTGNKKEYHKGLSKEARKLVKKAFKALAEAYQVQGEETL